MPIFWWPIVMGCGQWPTRTFPDVPIEVIPNGVDLPRFTSGYQRCPAPEVRILFVSRLIRRKGLQYLIDAVPAIREQAQQPFVIHIVGDGPDKELFTQQIEEAGLSRYFRFHGYVEHGKLPEYYLDADIFVLPSPGGRHAECCAGSPRQRPAGGGH